MNNIKYIVFDLDGTLMDETIFSQIYDLLKDLKTRGFHLSVASHNEYASFFCERYGLLCHMDYVAAFCPTDYDNPTKHPHLSSIVNYYKGKDINILQSEILLVDDREDVINCTKHTMPDIQTIQVNPVNGVTVADMKNIF